LFSYFDIPTGKLSAMIVYLCFKQSYSARCHCCWLRQYQPSLYSGTYLWKTALLRGV